jgi:LysR family glycine cleavage system transcriptional activator
MNPHWRLNMALNHLVAFESAVEKGSFTKAGESLGTTQPSISRHIASLEDLLDVQLFSRLHHRVELTESGRKFYDAVTLGLGHIRQAANLITSGQNTDTLSIGCTYGFAHLWLMPRFSTLQKLLSDQELRMITADTRTIFDLQEVDFALRFGNGNWPDGDSRKIFSEQLFPVCSPEFAERHYGGNRDVAPSSLVSVPLIHEQQEEYSWLSWQQWLARHGVDYEPAGNTYYYDSYALTLQAAMEGQGIALAWLHLAEEPLKNGQLIELKGLRVETDSGYYLAYRPNQPLAGMIVDWFKAMALLQETAQQDRPNT